MNITKALMARSADLLPGHQRLANRGALGWAPRAGAMALALGVLASCGNAQTSSESGAPSTPLTGSPDPGGESLESEVTESASGSGLPGAPGSSTDTGPGEPVTVSTTVSETAEEAAQGYMDALLAGDFDSAATWVVPEQQGMVQALGLGRGPETQPTMTGKMDVGTVKAAGEGSATVTFVGRMCRTAPAADGATSEQECITNDDPKTDRPYFHVQVTETSTYGWKVHFRPPTR